MDLQIKAPTAPYAQSLGMGNGMNLKNVAEGRGIGSNSLLFHQQATTIALPQWSEIRNFILKLYGLAYLDAYGTILPHPLGLMKRERARELRGIGSNSLLYHQQATTIPLPQWSEIENSIWKLYGLPYLDSYGTNKLTLQVYS